MLVAIGHVQPEHVVAGAEPGDVCSHPIDHPGSVEPERDRERVVGAGHLGQPARDLEVERVDPGGDEADDHVARSGFDDREVVQRRLLPELVDGHRSHVALLSSAEEGAVEPTVPITLRRDPPSPSYAGLVSR